VIMKVRVWCLAGIQDRRSRFMTTPLRSRVRYAERRTHADALAGRICAAAADAARSTCTLLELLGEFDAVDAIKLWTDFKSLAHWLSWTCS
jgi:hypothetical protein